MKNVRSSTRKAVPKTRPTVLVVGYTGAGKTSLVQAVFGEGMVPEDRVGHGEPRTRAFDSYESNGVRIYDSQGLEPGEGVEKRFIARVEAFVRSLRRRSNVDSHLHVVWYCIDGSRARVTECDLRLIRRLWPHTIVLVTKSDITRPKQYQQVAMALMNKGVDSSGILPCANTNKDQLQVVLKQTLQVLPEARRFALRQCMRLKLSKTYREHEKRVWAVAFSPKTDYLASAGKDDKVVLRRIDRTGKVAGRYVYRAGNDVNCIRFSPDGKFLAYGDDDGTVWIRSLTAGKSGSIRSRSRGSSSSGGRGATLATAVLGNYCYSVAFHPRKRLLAAGTKANAAAIYRYSVCSGVLGLRLISLLETSNDVNSVVFSSDGSSLLFVDDDGKLHKALLTGSIPVRSEHRISDDWIRSIDTHPHRPIAVLGGEDDTIRVVSVENTFQVLAELHRTDEVWSVRFSPCGELVVFGDGDGKIGIWEWEAGRLITDRLNGKSDDHVYSVDVSRDGRFIASGSWDNIVRLWPLPVGIS